MDNNFFQEDDDLPKLSIPTYWDTAYQGKKIFDYVSRVEGLFEPIRQAPSAYLSSLFYAGDKMAKHYSLLKNLALTDKYKHALLNCYGAQYGAAGNFVATGFSFVKEVSDIVLGKNTLDTSLGDNYANKIGRLLGTKYPEEACEDLVPKYIRSHW